jgi:hypothetical protein
MSALKLSSLSSMKTPVTPINALSARVNSAWVQSSASGSINPNFEFRWLYANIDGFELLW